MNQPKRKAVSHAYEQYDNQTDFKGYAKQVASELKQSGIPAETDPERLQHLIRNDLRSALPPQILGVIGRIISAVETLEKEEEQ